PRNGARRVRRGLEKPAAHRVKKRAQAPENRDAVQDDVEERLRRTAFETCIHEHELQPVRPVEQGSADQDEEEQPDERLLPVSAERRVRDRKSTRLNSSHLVISYA